MKVFQNQDRNQCCPNLDLEYSMYVSLFGNLKYSEKINHSIILKNKIVNDVERGNSPYGGYGSKASLVSYNGKTESRPILISREISRLIKNQIENRVLVPIS